MLASSLPLLVFSLLGSTAKKQGDFGIFTACTTKNESLRLDCYYAACKKSPSFYCMYNSSEGDMIANLSGDSCKLLVDPDQETYSTNYSCTLKRVTYTQAINMTINFGSKKGKVKPVNFVINNGRKEAIKACPDTTGVPLHRAPAALGPLLLLSLWISLDLQTHGT